MEPLNTTDAAIGWALIIGAALALWFGIPLLLKPLVDSYIAARERRREERELIQEELDDQFRDWMFAFLEQERMEREAKEREGRAPDHPQLQGDADRS